MQLITLIGLFVCSIGALSWWMYTQFPSVSEDLKQNIVFPPQSLDDARVLRQVVDLYIYEHYWKSVISFVLIYILYVWLMICSCICSKLKAR